MTTPLKGIVIKSTGSWYHVRTESGLKYQCRLAGKIRLDNRKTTNPVAVGDQIEFTSEGDDNGVIHKIYPRKNYIIRKSLNLSRQAHILALSSFFPKNLSGRKQRVPRERHHTVRKSKPRSPLPAENRSKHHHHKRLVLWARTRIR